MANNDSFNGFGAHEFFKKNNNDSVESVKEGRIKENLRQKVLSHYSNINNNNMSKDNIFSFFWKIFGVIGILSIFGVGFYFLYSDKDISLPKDSQMGLEFSFIEGDLEVMRNGEWFVASIDTELEQGDSIRSKEDSRAIISLDDGSAIRMNENSTIILSSLGVDNVVVANAGGEIYARITKSSVRKFSVLSSGIEYEAMGTAYRVLDYSEKKGVEVYASQVKVKDGEEEKVVDQGKKYYVLDKENEDNQDEVQQIVKEEDLADDEFVNWNKSVDNSVDEYKKDLGIFEDTKAPILKTTAPKNGSSTTSKTTTIKGSTEADALLYINGDSITNNEGKFSKKVSLKMGWNYFSVKAIDPAGNVSKVNLKIKRYEKPAPTPAPTTPVTTKSISVWSNGNATVSWKVNNFVSYSGFKVVWSKNSGPTYPTRSGDKYQYFSDKNTRTSSKLTAFDGAGYYYVRVCQYLGGKCGIYSNQIKVYLK